MKANLCGLQSYQVDDFWPHISDLISDALDYGTSHLTVDGVRESLKSGRYQCWLAWSDQVDAVAVTRIEAKDPKTLWILICTGMNPDEWFDYIETLESWGKSVGCVRSETLARPGWHRRLKAKGYKMRHVHMVKEL